MASEVHRAHGRHHFLRLSVNDDVQMSARVGGARPGIEPRPCQQRVSSVARAAVALEARGVWLVKA